MRASSSISNSKSGVFILKLLLFFALLGAVDWTVGSVIEQVHRRAPYGTNWTKENWLLSEQFDVVIFGSSRAFRHYVPSVISEHVGESVFNAGQNGQYLLYSYALEQLLITNYTPKLIVLDVLPSFVVKAKNPNEEFERLSSISPYFYNREVQKLLTRGNVFERIKYASKMYRYNSKLLSILDNLRGSGIKADNGYEVMGDFTFHDRNPFIVDQLDTVEIDSFKLSIVKKFITSARAKNINVIVSFSPVSEPLSEKVQQVVHFYEQLFTEMDVPFLNFATPEYQNKEIFLDLIHMDGVGAELFSREFGETLSRMDLLPSSSSVSN
jgi:hypothetical protein